MSRGAEWEADKELDRMHAEEAEAETLLELAMELTHEFIEPAVQDLSSTDWDAFCRGLWNGNNADWLAIREPIKRAIIKLALPKYRRETENARDYFEAQALGDYDA